MCDLTDAQITEAARRQALLDVFGRGRPEGEPEERLTTAERDKAELAAVLRGTLATLRDFIDYYEIPANHPDAQLIVTEARAAHELLRRLGFEPIGATS